MIVLDPTQRACAHFLLAMPPGLLKMQYDAAYEQLSDLAANHTLLMGGVIPDIDNPDFNLVLEREDGEELPRYTLNALLELQAKWCSELTMTGMEVPIAAGGQQ